MSLPSLNKVITYLLTRILLIWLERLIKREIVIVTGMVWPISTDKWKEL